jgi:hypothetical protein
MTTVLLQPLATGVGLISTAAFNLGRPNDFMVPDGGLHRALPPTVYAPTAAGVTEIESPDDKRWDKLGFYAEHGVDEVIAVSYFTRSVTWLGFMGEGGHDALERSPLTGVATVDLARGVDWPPGDPSGGVGIPPSTASPRLATSGRTAVEGGVRKRH